MQKSKSKIVWGQGALKSTKDLEDEEAREKHRQRAARFNTEYVEPGGPQKGGQKAASQEKNRPLQEKTRLGPRGRAPTKLYQPQHHGMDLRTPEEIAKRRQRAERFNLIQYESNAEEEAKLKRAAKFGIEYKPLQTALMDVDLFEERKDVPVTVPRRENAVHLYGVDLMSTKDVLSYFQEYGPLDVEWLHDSACNVVFDDSITAKKSIVQLGTPLPVQAHAPDSKGSEGLDINDIKNLPFFWHKGADFMKGEAAIPLLFRMATDADTRDPNAPKNSRYLWKDTWSQRRAGRGRQSQGQSQTGARSGGKRSQATLLEGPLEDADGDVAMKRRRKSRGGLKNRRKARQMQIDGDGNPVTDGGDGYEDVDMEDAEDWVEDGSGAEGLDEEFDDVEVEPVGVSDLRQLLSSKKVAAPIPLFSAAAAGITVPAITDEDPCTSNKAIGGVDEDSDAHQAEGYGAVDCEVQEPAGSDEGDLHHVHAKVDDAVGAGLDGEHSYHSTVENGAVLQEPSHASN